MVLKKQTVWLMTMLSLTIVLAVYYITSPSEVAETDPESSEESEMTAATDEAEWIEWLEEEDMQATLEETEPEGEEASEQESESPDAPVAVEGSLFSELRMEKQESQSKLREEYTNTIASDEYSAAEKSEAFDKREQLAERQQNESTLESIIQAEGYSDAVVISDDEKTRIIVEAKELTSEDAVMLNRLASEHLGETEIVIGHHAQAAAGQ
ncbi:stage III sporulation protein AH [Alteribacillus persepolensis]|uniref:Stage III sporulation protein AH n=1 Tax=Alteribacillus persepolensis TaxID=568899 RepID=A0A1G8D032_9BACI|nr:SpoIIIAH-like family protein [Alteribacillus persepolensis]SDH51081.1 stage III sporulation protein AH [Alteribacillus persepolensis]